MLTEFAKFAQSRVPVMLAEFARYKQITSANPQMLMKVLADPMKLLAGIHRVPKARLFEAEVESRTDATTDDMTDSTTEMMVETTTMMVDETTMSVEETTMAVDPTTMAVDPTTMAVDPTTMAAEPTTLTVDPTTMGVEPATTDARQETDIETNIENAVQNILDAIKGAMDSFKNEPLSIAAIQGIGTGVLNGIKLIAEELGFTLPDEIPDVNLPGLPDVNLPSLPSLPDIDFPDLPDFSLPSIPNLPDLDLSLADWPWICKVVWWPHEDEHCEAMRCAACSTAMIASARACEKAEGSVSHFCMRRILGDSGCNYCTADYLGY